MTDLYGGLIQIEIHSQFNIYSLNCQRWSSNVDLTFVCLWQFEVTRLSLEIWSLRELLKDASFYFWTHHMKSPVSSNVTVTFVMVTFFCFLDHIFRTFLPDSVKCSATATPAKYSFPFSILIFLIISCLGVAFSLPFCQFFRWRLVFFLFLPTWLEIYQRRFYHRSVYPTYFYTMHDDIIFLRSAIAFLCYLLELCHFHDWLEIIL